MLSKEKTNDSTFIDRLNWLVKEYPLNLAEIVAHGFGLKRDLYAMQSSKCAICGKHESEVQGKLNLHIMDLFAAYPNKDEAKLVCGDCHAKEHEGVVLKKKSNRQKVMGLAAQLLEAAGVDLDDENFFETPRRMTDVLMNCLNTEEDIAWKIEEIASQVFPGDLEQMVVTDGIRVYGVCPHHIVPVIYDIQVGYIPAGVVMGLSKFGRVAEMLSSVPYLQETLTNRIMTTLQGMLGTKSVAVKVRGRHMCMITRGVKMQLSNVTTSAVGGVFLEGSVKKEFMDICHQGGSNV